jgi:hypothetical protein
MNGAEQEIAYTGIRMLLKRWQSRSPALFRKIQWVSGIAASLWAVVIALDQAGLFAFMSATAHTRMVVVVTAIGSMLSGAGFVAKLPSTDPSLVSQEVKDAILNEAEESRKS